SGSAGQRTRLFRTFGTGARPCWRPDFASAREGACDMRRYAAGGLAAASLLLLAGPAAARPAPAPAAAPAVAPGAPGAAANWTPADKHGFGTAAGTGSKVWY